MFTGSTSKRNILALYRRRWARILLGAEEVSSLKAAKVLSRIALAERWIKFG